MEYFPVKTLSAETLREMAVFLYGSNLAIAEIQIPVFVERHEEFLPVIHPFRFTCLNRLSNEFWAKYLLAKLGKGAP